MTKYNIEFAHIYADKNFGDEQERSINVLKSLIKELEFQKSEFVTCILIDEVSPSLCKFKNILLIDSRGLCILIARILAICSPLLSSFKTSIDNLLLVKNSISSLL